MLKHTAQIARLLPLFSWGVLVTCGGEAVITDPGGNSNGSNNTVASVTVTPSSATVEVGGSVQFTAQARNSSGSPLSGVSFTWSSSNAGVAAVSGGLATGSAAGNTTINASAGGVSGSASLSVTEIAPAFSGFDFQLSQGQYWDFYWSYEYNETSGPQAPARGEAPTPAPQANIHSVTGGHFRITLGTPRSIQGITAYELVMSGDYSDGNWDYTPRWQYLALVDHQIMGSEDGQTLTVVFDAKNGTWHGGGFWALYADEVEVSGATSQIDNEFITTQAIAVRRSEGQSFCETIAGHTICSNDQAWSFSESEYFKAGIGPVGLHSYAGHSFSGGGFYDSFSHERHVGLVASSLPGASGIVPLAPPWIKKSPMPVARSRHTATAVNGKVYVMGGEQRTETTTTVLSSVSIYDPTNDSWTSGASMPAARVGHTSTAYGSKIYVVGGRTSSGSSMESNLWEYDPATNSWRDLSPTYTAFADHSSVIWDTYVMLFPGTNNEVWAYQVTTDQWFVGSNSPTRYRRHATGVVGNKMYLVGGSYTDWSPWVGNFTAYTTNCLSYDVTSDVWSFTTSMPTPRAELATVVVDGKVIAIGGNNADGPQRAVEMYDPAADTWTERFPLTAGLKDHTAVEVNGKVYVMGGSGYWDSVATVYEYDPANEW